MKSMGGTRAIRPRLSGSGRPRHGIRPSVARGEQARAVDQRVGVARRHRARRTHRSRRRSRRMAALRPRLQLARHRRCRTVTPVPCAARAVASREQRARARLVVRIAGAPAGDADIDRRRGRSLDAPSSSASVSLRVTLTSLLNACAATSRVHDGGRPGAGPARQRTNRSEAPRPARDQHRRQVSWLAGLARRRLPGVFPVALWLGLAAYSCGGSCGFGRSALPHSLFLSSRETVDRAALKAASAAFVNASRFRFARRQTAYRSLASSVPAKVRPRGNAVRARSNAAAAPATVSGEFARIATGRRLGKARRH